MDLVGPKLKVGPGFTRDSKETSRPMGFCLKTAQTTRRIWIGVDLGKLPAKVSIAKGRMLVDVDWVDWVFGTLNRRRCLECPPTFG